MLGIAAAHAAPLTVAVYDFKGDADAAGYGNKVTALVTADLTTKTNLALVERSELDKALNEEAFGLSGMVNSEAAAKIGQITGAKVLVAGQVIKTGGDHLILIANVVGTETCRMFADKVEGSADNLSELTSDLSRKIAQTVSAQSTNLILPPVESDAARRERILKNVQGTNRPSVSINIRRYGQSWNESAVENELGSVLLKAGFTVADARADRKPDVEIIGGSYVLTTTRRGDLYSCSVGMDLKIQERRSGNILGLERFESLATGAGETAAGAAAWFKLGDAAAERIMPILAK